MALFWFIQTPIQRLFYEDIFPHQMEMWRLIVMNYLFLIYSTIVVEHTALNLTILVLKPCCHIAIKGNILNVSTLPLILHEALSNSDFQLHCVLSSPSLL
jgi:hypothetical protein